MRLGSSTQPLFIRQEPVRLPGREVREEDNEARKNPISQADSELLKNDAGFQPVIAAGRSSNETFSQLPSPQDTIDQFYTLESLSDTSTRSDNESPPQRPQLSQIAQQRAVDFYSFTASLSSGLGDGELIGIDTYA